MDGNGSFEVSNGQELSERQANNSRGRVQWKALESEATVLGVRGMVVSTLSAGEVEHDQSHEADTGPIILCRATIYTDPTPTQHRNGHSRFVLQTEGET